MPAASMQMTVSLGLLRSTTAMAMAMEAAQLECVAAKQPGTDNSANTVSVFTLLLQNHLLHTLSLDTATKSQSAAAAAPTG